MYELTLTDRQKKLISKFLSEQLDKLEQLGCLGNVWLRNEADKELAKKLVRAIAESAYDHH